jgi:hypothetical protein
VSRAPSPLCTLSVTALPTAGAPQDGLGAGTCAHQPTDMKTEHVARDGRRLAGSTAEKNWHNPLLGRVCLLTTGGLIRVGPRSLEESSDNGHVVTGSYCSRRSDHGVHPSAGELTEIADLHPIVVNERPQNIGILG